MLPPLPPASGPELPAPPAELQALLAATAAAVHVLQPLHYAGGRGIRDFQLAYLNPAAQQLPGLPQQVGGTVLGSGGRPAADNLLYYYLRVFEAGGSSTYDAALGPAGQGPRYHYAARRQAGWLVVYITELPAPAAAS